MTGHPHRFALVALGLLGACAQPEPEAAPRERRAADKEAIYADAALVPTREGEKARREIALAGEIEAAVEVAMGTPHVAADVELDDPPRVAVAIRLPTTAPEAARATVQALAAAIVREAEVVVAIGVPEASPSTPAEPERPAAWLALSLLGLGLSLGVAIERLRARRVRRPRR